MGHFGGNEGLLFISFGFTQHALILTFPNVWHLFQTNLGSWCGNMTPTLQIGFLLWQGLSFNILSTWDVLCFVHGLPIQVQKHGFGLFEVMVW